MTNLGACPHGKMRDPVDPKKCIPVAGSFSRIAELLGQYLHANQPSISIVDRQQQSSTESDDNVDQLQPNRQHRYKATVDNGDQRVQFEWSSIPTRVRRAFDWLI
jgi:hypothetical protein